MRHAKWWLAGAVLFLAFTVEHTEAIPINQGQVEALVKACQDAWGSNAPGIPVINANHVFKGAQMIGGQGAYHFSCGGDVGQHTTWTIDKNWWSSRTDFIRPTPTRMRICLVTSSATPSMLHTTPADNLMSKEFIQVRRPSPHV